MEALATGRNLLSTCPDILTDEGADDSDYPSAQYPGDFEMTSSDEDF